MRARAAAADLRRGDVAAVARHHCEAVASGRRRRSGRRRFAAAAGAGGGGLGLRTWDRGDGGVDAGAGGAAAELDALPGARGA